MEKQNSAIHQRIIMDEYQQFMLLIALCLMAGAVLLFLTAKAVQWLWRILIGDWHESDLITRRGDLES